MTMKHFFVYFLLSLLPFYSYTENHIDIRYLNEGFNICPYWHDGMTWEEYGKIRKKMKEVNFIQYFDKIYLIELAQEIGLEVPKIYMASREKIPFTHIISELPSYVVKPSHLSLGQGLIIIKNGTDMITGKPTTPEEVQERIFKSFDEKPIEWESWALHQVQPGFIVQEYIPERLETKIQVVWGKAIIGECRSGESKRRLTRIWGRYDRYGNQVDPRKTRKVPKWWPEAVKAAEKVALAIGADTLRVDFLVKEDGHILLNELETAPGSKWKSMKTALETRLNDGYRNLCER